MQNAITNTHFKRHISPTPFQKEAMDDSFPHCPYTSSA